MEFPLLNISKKNWSENDLLDHVIFEPFIYSDNQKFIKNYLINNSFCDCNGNVYKVRELNRPKQYWRHLLKFIPGIYKVEVVFYQTTEIISLADLKDFVISRLKSINTNGLYNNWIKEVSDAKRIKDILHGVELVN